MVVPHVVDCGETEHIHREGSSWLSVWAVVCPPPRDGEPFSIAAQRTEPRSPALPRNDSGADLEFAVMLAANSILLRSQVSGVTTAYVLVQTDPGREKQVHDALRLVPAITDVTPLFGEYDLIAKIHGADIDDIQAIVLGSIRTIPGLVDTRTLAGAKS